MKTKAELDYINERTKWLLAHKWCHHAVERGGWMPDGVESAFKDHAIAKGWVSGRDGKILAKGWKTAAAFLRR